MLGKKGHFIKDDNLFSEFIEGYGWFGTLQIIENNKVYLLKTN
jgi:hypothetical protein